MAVTFDEILAITEQQINAAREAAMKAERINEKMKQAQKQRDKSRSRLNFVSQREFRYYRGADVFTDLVRNYAARISNRAHTTVDMRELGNQVFGEYWWEQSNSKLYALAKMSSEKRGCEKPYWDMTTQQKHWAKVINSGRRRQHALYDSSFYRICKRFYKASVFEEWLDTNTNLQNNKSYYSSIENMLRNLAKIAVAVRKYDKEDLPLLKRISSVDELARISGNTNYFCKYDGSWMSAVVNHTMTESQGNKLIHDNAHAYLTQTLSKDAEKVAWATVKTEFISRVIRRYSDADSWHAPMARVIKAAYIAKNECDKVFDAERIAEKLGLSITGGSLDKIPYISWRVRKLNGRVYKMLKELERAYDSGADLDVIQCIAKKRSESIHNEMYWKSSMYTPVFI